MRKNSKIRIQNRKKFKHCTEENLLYRAKRRIPFTNVKEMPKTLKNSHNFFSKKTKNAV